MKLPEGKLYIEAVCAKAGSGRPPLESPYLRDGVLLATDSYKAVRIPVEQNGEPDGYIPVEVFKAARKAKTEEIVLDDQGFASVDGSLTLGGKTVVTQTFERQNAGTFPDLAACWPGSLSKFAIGLNAKYLLAVAQAMGTDEVCLRFAAAKDNGSPSPDRPIVVTPIRNGVEGADGLVMPVKLEGR